MTSTYLVEVIPKEGCTSSLSLALLFMHYMYEVIKSIYSAIFGVSEACCILKMSFSKKKITTPGHHTAINSQTKYAHTSQKIKNIPKTPYEAVTDFSFSGNSNLLSYKELHLQYSVKTNFINAA